MTTKKPKRRIRVQPILENLTEDQKHELQEALKEAKDKEWGGVRPGAGRPKEGWKRGTISLKPETWIRLKAEAKWHALTNSEMLEHIISQFQH